MKMRKVTRRILACIPVSIGGYTLQAISPPWVSRNVRSFETLVSKQEE